MIRGRASLSIAPTFASDMRARIFYSGTHTDADGRTIPFPPERVRAIAARYNAEQARHAPAVKGHPATDDPAQGWLNHAVEVVENNPGPGLVALYGRFDRVQPTFAEECRSGAYRFTSIKLYPDDLIRHVGFLGGAQPALAGTEIAFSQGDGETIISLGSEFAEATTDSTTTQGTPMTPEEITALTDGLVAGLKPSIDEISAKLDTIISGNDAASATDAAGADAGAAGSFSQSDEYKALSGQVADLRAKNLDLEFSQFLDSEPMKKRISPALRPSVKTKLMGLSALDSEVEFSGADGKKVKGSAVDAYKAELMTWAEFPLGVQFASHDNEPEKLDEDESFVNAMLGKKKEAK